MTGGKLRKGGGGSFYTCVEIFVLHIRKLKKYQIDQIISFNVFTSNITTINIY